jgi:signal transduction histidine kinase/ligand-binding sensor domain-containing protein
MPFAPARPNLCWGARVAAALVLAATPALALDPGRALASYSVDAWSVDRGLPENSVFAVVQTRDGYLWVGTTGGLARFDGLRFTTFDKTNTSAIRHNQIQALLEDHAGALWIGTYGGGLACLKDGRFRSYTTRDGLASDTVRSISQSRDGTLWIGTHGAGLARLQDGVFRTLTIRDGLAGDLVRAVRASRDGTVWVGTNHGLNRLRGEVVETLTTGTGLLHENVTSLFEDRRGRMWIGTSGGLNVYADGRLHGYTTSDGLSAGRVFSIQEDRDGNLWVGTEGGGLNRFRGGRFEAVRAKDGLGSDAVRALHEDREGNLWIGTYGGGLARVRDGFVVHTAQDGLPDDHVRAVLEDRRGSVWAATAAGLGRWQDGRWRSYTKEAGLSDDAVLSLCEDHVGALWVGTRDGGLHRFLDGRFQVFTTRQGLPNNTVMAIAEGRDGVLWVGTEGGVARFAQGRFTVYGTAQGLSFPEVRAIHEDRRGDLWIGTFGGGLNRFRDGRFTSWTRREGLSNDFVYSIHEDADGALWIGTLGEGLNRIQDGRLTVFRVKDGLFHDVIFRVMEDDHDNLWMSSNRGIFRVSRRDLLEHAAGRRAHVTSVSYGVADGMKTNECTGGPQPAGWRARDGRLWFPTRKGLVVIDPEHVRANTLPPPVAIEQVRADRIELPPGAALEAPPGRGELEFQYTGISFLGPENMRFRYKLEGFDADWVEAGTRRLAHFTNLAPGTYRFRVKAQNKDGVWNEGGAVVDVRLAPHFYQTRWFLASAILGALASAVGLTLAAGWGIHRVRVSQMKARFGAVLAERNRIARELHDTLDQAFTGLGLQLDAALARLGRRDIDSARAHLDVARQLVRHSQSEARRSVRDLRSTTLEGVDLATALSRAAAQISAGTLVRIVVHIQGTARPLSSDVEQNLLRIGQEALTNAIKHAQAHEVHVDLSFDADRVELHVRDDGRGFDAASPEARTGHFGLLGMRERADQLGGELHLRSGPDRGTEVVVAVPVGK